jgi:hypothetical protein
LEILTNILLVGLGAVLGYFGTSIATLQENRARRKLLIGMLKYELRRVTNQFPQYDASRTFHRDPLRFASVDKLVDGDCLNYFRDSQLIQELLLFRNAVARYNDIVSVTNYTQNYGNMPDDMHREVFDIVGDYHSLIREVKERIIALLPGDVEDISLLHKNATTRMKN